MSREREEVSATVAELYERARHAFSVDEGSEMGQDFRKWGQALEAAEWRIAELEEKVDELEVTLDDEEAAHIESQFAQQAKPVDWEAIARINWRATWNTNGPSIDGWAAGAKAVIAAYTAAQSGGKADAQGKAND